MQWTEKQVSDLFDYATFIRGMAINQSVIIEKIIERYIAVMLCEPEKVDELIDLILGNERITFEAKKQVFKVMVEKYDNVFAKDGQVFKDLDEIIKKRNIMAHYLLDSSPEFINTFNFTDIRFIKFKDKRKPVIYKKQEIEDYFKLIDDTVDKLNIFIDFVASCLHLERINKQSNSSKPNSHQTI